MRSTLARARVVELMALGLASGTAAILLADFVAPSLVASTRAREDLARIAGEQRGEERDGQLPFTIAAERDIFLICVGPDGWITTDRSGLGGLAFSESCTENPLWSDILLDAPSAATQLSFHMSGSADSQVDVSAAVEASEAAVHVSDQDIPDHSLDIGLAHAVAVPEPSTFTLVLGGLIGLAVRRSSRG